MKFFSIYPLADLNKELVPGGRQVMLPANSTVTCHQYANHVYLTVHSKANQTRTALREIIFATPNKDIPDEFECIGTLVANEAAGPEPEEGDVDEDGDDFLLEEIPSDPEEFYSALFLVNVYISPDKTVSDRDGKSWSFIRERR